MKMKKTAKGRNEKRAKRDKNQGRGIESCFEEARRYYRNGRSLLKEAGVEYRTYKDKKKVAEASGMAYLGMLRAVEGYLLKRGWEEEKLPESYHELVRSLKKVSAHNGKLLSSVNAAYESLHILGYYRGGRDTRIIKEGMEAAKLVIETVIGKRV